MQACRACLARKTFSDAKNAAPAKPTEKTPAKANPAEEQLAEGQLAKANPAEVRLAEEMSAKAKLAVDTPAKPA